VKAHYCHGKNFKANHEYISPLFDELKLKAQPFFFKMTMMVNFVTTMKLPLDCNPCSKMLAFLTTNYIICHKLLKWLNLVELSMARV
jgi:hypothetical protein